MKLLHVDSEEFRKQRVEFLKKIDENNKHEELKFQIPGVKYSKWCTFDEFPLSAFELNDSMLRFPMNNEIIIDIDKKIYLEDGKTLDKQECIKASLKIVNYIVGELDKENLKYSVYFSGNKGFHIKLLIGGFDISKKQLINAMKLKGHNSLLFIKNLKEAFLRYFDFEIGINGDMAIDPCLLGKKQLVRTEGSLHDKSQLWKTYLLPPYTEEKIFGEVLGKLGNMTRINVNYLKETNILSKELSEYIFNYIKINFERDLIRKSVVSKYKSKDLKFNKKMIGVYIEVFKDLYLSGQRYMVTPAIISYLYLVTEANEVEARKIYYTHFSNLSDSPNQFEARFIKVWADNLEAEKISIYGILETHQIISKEEFKEKLKLKMEELRK